MSEQLNWNVVECTKMCEQLKESLAVAKQNKLDWESVAAQALSERDKIKAHNEILQKQIELNNNAQVKQLLEMKAELEQLKHQKLDETLVKTIANRDHWRTIALAAKKALEEIKGMTHQYKESLDMKDVANKALGLYPPEEKKP